MEPEARPSPFFVEVSDFQKSILYWNKIMEKIVDLGFQNFFHC